MSEVICSNKNFKMKSIKIWNTFAMIFMVSLIFGNSFDVSGQNNTSKPLPQFLFSSFEKGLIHMKDGREMTAILNYNMVEEEMVFQQGNQYLVLDKPEEIDTIYLRNRRFVFTDKAFYEVINSGKVILFIQHKSRYTEKGTATAYGMTTKTAATINVTSIQGGNQVRHLELPDNVIVTTANVFWANINGEMRKFTSQNQFIKLFPGSEEKIKEFIKANNIDLKSREGLMNLGNFINSMN
jgi:hypothetical protein